LEVQLEGLADGAKRVLNRGSADLVSSTRMPFTDVTGKSLQDGNPSWSVDASQERVHSTEAGEVTPMRPISQPNFLTLIQDPIGGVSPRSTEKTRELTALCSWSSSQELSCGRGKSALN
jgi:hypothetical protein